LITFKESSWLITLSIYHQPFFPDQPEGVAVWWGYGLFHDRPGDFVKKPMSACTGAEIMTETMERRPEIGFASYDRFFPSQDTMPKGGFGNLIALPLQQLPRSHGNSVFLASDFNPHPDQWAFLSGIRLMSFSEIETLVRDVERTDEIIGVRRSVTDDDSNEDPWTLPPSRKAGRSRARASEVVSGRGCSSASTMTGSPLRCGTEMGTSWSRYRPSESAAAALRWLSRAKASWSARPTPSRSATFSPVSPIEYGWWAAARAGLTNRHPSVVSTNSWVPRS